MHEEKKFADGEVIFREGDPGNVMYFISSGQVRITKKMGSLESQLGILKEGEFFGEIALFENVPRNATATSIGETTVVVADREALSQMIKERPDVALAIIQKMCARVRKVDDEITKIIESLFS